MDFLPQGYQLDAPTWFYLSLLLILAVYFRFHRLWSLRNVDLCLILCASPGLLLVESGAEAVGFALLFGVTGVLLVRLLLDPLLTRRPHTTQNLNPAGMAFLCASAFVLLSMQVISQPLPPETEESIALGEDLIGMNARSEAELAEDSAGAEVEKGPAVSVMAAPFVVFKEMAARVMAMAAHLAVIVGLLFAGRNLFGDVQLGTAMATLYMLLPCTAYDVGAVNHVLPAALIVWAIVAYKRPATSGALMGMACGTLVFPLFLVPLWTAFYGRRGAVRFLATLFIVFAVLLGSYALTSADPDSFWRQTIGTIRLPVLALMGQPDTASFWGDLDSVYRTPFIAGYFVMLLALTIWPREKSIEHLIAGSAALIVGTQFWYPQQGGVYLLWYLPLLLMVIFRPRIAQLEQHKQQSTVADVKADSSHQDVRPSSHMTNGFSSKRVSNYR